MTTTTIHRPLLADAMLAEEIEGGWITVRLDGRLTTYPAWRVDEIELDAA
jgi:hypothetical protein